VVLLGSVTDPVRRRVHANVKLPNFFIVGAPKAGTTSLHAYLGQHPQVYMSPVKEPSYFAPDLCWAPQIFSWEGYLGLFSNVRDEIAIGEATASYLWSQTAARNIAAHVPQARIIISLRNPVDRAFSQYLQMLSHGVTRRSFREQIIWSLRGSSGRKFGLLWPFLELGLYSEQISRYFDHFPRSRIHISCYEELARAPGRLMAELFSFLDVDPAFVPNVCRRHNEPQILRANWAVYWLKQWGAWAQLRKLAPLPLGPRLRSLLVRSRGSLHMQPADHAFLTDYYRDDIARLASLLNRDLSAWLDPGAGLRERVQVSE
jgi:hypothetical protein